MSRLSLPAEGGCRCGQVRLRIAAPPLITMACHCKGCQRMTASAFSLSAAIPKEAFEVIEGEPVIGGVHGPELHHYCCPYCMSWLFTRIDWLTDFVNLRVTMLDDASWYSPYIETCTAEALPWAKTGATHSFEKFPDMEGFGALIDGYRQSLGYT